jgi:hypothetical protein
MNCTQVLFEAGVERDTHIRKKENARHLPGVFAKLNG